VGQVQEHVTAVQCDAVHNVVQRHVGPHLLCNTQNTRPCSAIENKLLVNQSAAGLQQLLPKSKQPHTSNCQSPNTCRMCNSPAVLCLPGSPSPAPCNTPFL
jgi:hypothetical protein